MSTPPPPPPQPHQQPQQGSSGNPQGQQPPFPGQGHGGGPPHSQEQGFGPPVPPQQGFGPPIPPQPYPPQQAYGPPGGWGAPQPPPPPKKRRVGLLVTVPVMIATALAVYWLSKNVLGDEGSGKTFPEAEYRLTLPPKLLDGAYELSDDMSQQTQERLAEASQAVVRAPRAATGQYDSVNGTEAGFVIVSGLYGRIADPDRALDEILEGAGEAKGTEIAVPAKDYTPKGSEVRVRCQVMVSSQSDGRKATIPFCAWADENTNASVSMATPESLSMTPEAVDLKKVAEATVKIRQELRRPIA